MLTGMLLSSVGPIPLKNTLAPSLAYECVIVDHVVRYGCGTRTTEPGLAVATVAVAELEHAPAVATSGTNEVET